MAVVSVSALPMTRAPRLAHNWVQAILASVARQARADSGVTKEAALPMARAGHRARCSLGAVGADIARLATAVAIGEMRANTAEAGAIGSRPVDVPLEVWEVLVVTTALSVTDAGPMAAAAAAVGQPR